MLLLQIYVSALAAYPNHFTTGQNDATRKISVQNLKLHVEVFLECFGSVRSGTD